MLLPKPSSAFRVDTPEVKTVFIRYKRTIIAAGVGLAALLGIVLWVGGGAPVVDMTDLKAGSVTRGDLSLGVSGYGKLAPSSLLVISSKNGGRVATIEKRVGSTIGRGEVLLTIENPELQQKSREVEKALAEKRVDFLTVESDASFRRNELKSDLQNRRDDLRIANLELAGSKVLAENRIITLIDLEKAVIKVSTLQRQIEDLANESRQLDRLYIAIGEANAEVKRTLVDDLQRLRREVDELTVRAPSDAIIFEMQPDLNVGSQISPGTTIFRLSLTDNLDAEVAVPSVRANEVILGQSAIVRVGNEVLPAKVHRIDPQVQRDEVTVVLSLDEARPRGVFVGQPVSAEITVTQYSDVAYLARPADAVEGQSGSLFVVDSVGGSLYRRKVHYGAGDGRHIIIERGLKDGEKVILSDMQQYVRHPILGIRN